MASAFGVVVIIFILIAIVAICYISWKKGCCYGCIRWNKPNRQKKADIEMQVHDNSILFASKKYQSQWEQKADEQPQMQREMHPPPQGQQPSYQQQQMHQPYYPQPPPQPIQHAQLSQSSQGPLSTRQSNLFPTPPTQIYSREAPYRNPQQQTYHMHTQLQVLSQPTPSDQQLTHLPRPHDAQLAQNQPSYREHSEERLDLPASLSPRNAVPFTTQQSPPPASTPSPRPSRAKSAVPKVPSAKLAASTKSPPLDPPTPESSYPKPLKAKAKRKQPSHEPVDDLEDIDLGSAAEGIDWAVSEVSSTRTGTSVKRKSKEREKGKARAVMGDEN